MGTAKLIRSMFFGLLLATLGSAQSGSDQQSTTTQTKAQKGKKVKKSPGAAREMGNGAGNIGAGAGKGAGSLAKGTAKGAGDLVTLHPVGAAGSVGKGAAGAGKDVGVGTAKGTGKVAKGVGKAVKHIF
jgi:hypothetical protein